jgi:O-methyltransferase domain
MPTHQNFEFIFRELLRPIEFSILTAILELGVLENLSKAPANTNEIANKFDLSPKVLNSVLNALTALSFLKFNDDKYYLSANADIFLSSYSQFSVRKEFLRYKILPVHDRILKALKRKNPTLDYNGESLTRMWEQGTIDKRTAELFNESMAQIMNYPSSQLSKSKLFSQLSEIADVGGGSLVWAKNLLGAQPNLKVVVFDLPVVIDVAANSLQHTDRLSLVGGNFFIDQLPKCSSFLMSNILHDWPIEKCEIILKNIRQAAQKNSHLFINECLLAEDKLGPVAICLFDVLMSINHGAQQFTFTELNRLLEKCGYSCAEAIETVGPYSLLVTRAI